MRDYYYYCLRKNAYGILYQVTVSLGRPYRILDFSGPFKGSCSDSSIIKATIIPQISEEEKIMCDKAYRFVPNCWTASAGKFSSLSSDERREYITIAKIRQLNERVIGRLAQWGVMKKKWPLSFDLHRLCARAVAKLTQLELFIYPLN